MKILLIHNRYRIRSGEHYVFSNEVRMLQKFGHDTREIIFDNINITSIYSKLKSGFLSLYNPAASRSIRQTISEFKPDVIHVHNFFPQVSPAVFFRRTRNKVPIVLTLHNFRLVCANALLFRDNKPCEKCINKIFPITGIFHRCYRNSFIQTLNVVLMTSIHKIIGTWKGRVDRYIALSEFQREKILNSSLGLKSDQIVVKPNFVFNEGIDDIGDRGGYYLFVGRLEQDKGVNTLLSAFRDLEYDLKIIGDGYMRSKVEDVCTERKNIEFLGPRENQFVLRMLRKARGFIFPSFYYEGFPLVIAESFSCGTPVFTSDDGSQAKIVRDGYNGIHFKGKDPEDLKRRIIEFEKTGNIEMYKNAYDTYMKLYNEKENHKILIKIYKDIIEDKMIV